MSRPREQVIPASDDNARMNAKHRRLLQTLSVVALLAYTALLAYPTLSRGAVDDEASPSGKVQRIRSLHEDPTVTSESSSATATLRPPTTVLDDVFISVKTTKSYHNHRLPIILKTWFQLAKAQVTTHVGRVSAPWERGSVEGVFGSRNGGIIDGTKTPTGGPPAAEFPPELALSSKLTTS
ncbi:hypothetical protein MTP99_016396 [Tenebrio molitor]|nr:hypothetical protein MTP99_016396 [Tenebrio molitor]